MQNFVGRIRVVGVKSLGYVEEVGDVTAALNRGLRAVDPAALLKKHVKRKGSKIFIDGRVYDLESFSDFVILAVGKAADGMAYEMLNLLRGREVRGIVVVPRGRKPMHSINSLQIVYASHPVPDENSVKAAQLILETAETCTKNTLTFVLISGGASALAAAPAEDISLEDKQAVTAQLLKAGASIDELNTVRKHLSRIKGGWLAKKLRSTVVSLILSDVVGDKVDVIASGPTAPDPTTYQDAANILNRYGVAASEAVWRHMRRGVEGQIPETPKPSDPCFKNVFNKIIGGNVDAVKNVAAELRKRGYRCIAFTSELTGEAREAAKLFAAIAHSSVKHGIPHRPPLAVVAGGETTVTVKGRGKGGRNTEIVLATAIQLRDISGYVFASMGTDGVDGPTDAAGAVATPKTLKIAAEKGLDAEKFLAENDSYTFFAEVGGLIYTGPTGTNVGDVMVLINIPRSMF